MNPTESLPARRPAQCRIVFQIRSLEGFDLVESWMSLGRSRPQVGPGRWTGPFGASDQKTRSRPAAGTYFLPEPEEIQSSLAKTMQHWATRRPP